MIRWLLKMLHPRSDFAQRYDGKLRADCEHCGRTIQLRVSKSGEILNLRMIGGYYACRECGEAACTWDLGEPVWIKGSKVDR
jgi:hypothetical protein